MQSIVLIIAVAAAFIFGFCVVRSLGRFLDENQNDQEPETDHAYLEDEVEKQDSK